jgi:hypothetical protein
MSERAFAQQYGPWGLVAGGSEGLGGAWSSALASRGLNVVVVSNDEATLQAKTCELTADYPVEVRPVHADLASDDMLTTLERATADLEIGCLVYNAALADLCPFADQPLERELYRLNLNCRGPLVLSHHYGRLMLERGRGGIVLMSSLGGLMGNPYNVGYAASKAYDYVLAEGLWYEYGRKGVDVIASLPGLIKTHENITDSTGGDRPMAPEDVVEETLAQLGKVPSMSPGQHNRTLRDLLTKELPREQCIEFMARTYEKNWPDQIAGE